jgi:hypothetical protein
MSGSAVVLFPTVFDQRFERLERLERFERNRRTVQAVQNVPKVQTLTHVEERQGSTGPPARLG